MTAAESAESHAEPPAAQEAQDAYYALAETLLPGASLGGHALPQDTRFIIERGEGSRLRGVDGRWRVDFVCGAGALILGHAHPAPTEAIRDQATRGVHFFGTLNEPCLDLARELVAAIPCAEKIVYATTGSEATFYALRIARAATGKDKILKFEGGYHGNHDYSAISVAPKAASNYPAGQPETGGVPGSVQAEVLIAPYNDLDAVRRIVAGNRDALAAIIVEPTQRIIAPDPGFLEGLRALCDEYGVLLIFDEVVTGFRLAYGGAQEKFGVLPDLASYGKIVGGGAPLGCVAGPAALIDLTDPHRKGDPRYAYVNGTLHGNPLASAAGLATLAALRKPGFYATLDTYCAELRRACQAVLDRHRLPARVCGDGSLWQILFLDEAPRNHIDVACSDMARARALDIACMREGLYLLPGVRRFVSAVHDGADLEETVRALDAACRAVA